MRTSKYAEQESKIPAIIAADEGIDTISLCKLVYGTGERIHQKAIALYMKKNPQFYKAMRRGSISRFYTSEQKAKEINRPFVSIVAWWWCQRG